jgi:RNA polymerase sigma-70 factor (ECF subfamily)
MSVSAAAAVPPVEDVVLLALRGDRDAEAEVCRRIMGAVRAFAARRLTGSAVDDFAQDVLLLVIDALREGRIEEPAHVASFALGVCRNLARERARASDRRAELLQRFGMTEEDLVVFDAPLMLRRAHLEDCFSKLTERARQVIRATFCDDEDDAPIADALAISTANVRVIRHRAIAALRECLQGPISWEDGR